MAQVLVLPPCGSVQYTYCYLTKNARGFQTSKSSSNVSCLVILGRSRFFVAKSTGDILIPFRQQTAYDNGRN